MSFNPKTVVELVALILILAIIATVIGLYIVASPY